MKITEGMLAEELRRLQARSEESRDEGFSTLDVCRVLNIGQEKARNIIRAAIAGGEMEVREVLVRNMTGRRTKAPRYFVTPNPAKSAKK